MGGSSRAADRFRYAIVDGMNVRDSRVHNYPPRWNAVPSQELIALGPYSLLEPENDDPSIIEPIGNTCRLG